MNRAMEGAAPSALRIGLGLEFYRFRRSGTLQGGFGSWVAATVSKSRIRTMNGGTKAALTPALPRVRERGKSLSVFQRVGRRFSGHEFAWLARGDPSISLAPHAIHSPFGRGLG